MDVTWWLFIFVTLLGACVGSFLNVVVYRLPAGLSLISPGSACPQCQRPLAWFENIPVIAWIILRGRCRTCGASISIQYPLVEALCAGLFAITFAACYLLDWRPAFSSLGLAQTWPIFAVYLFLVAALLASSVIDAKLYIIPLVVPWWATAVAAVVIPVTLAVVPGSVQHVAVNIAPQSPTTMRITLGHVDPAYADVPAVEVARNSGRAMQVPVTPAPYVEARAAMMSIGAMGGLAVAVVLLFGGVLPRSFAEELQSGDAADSPVTSAQSPTGVAAEVDPPMPRGESDVADEYLGHPHPRREVLKECLFLALPIVGAIVGWHVLPWTWAAGQEWWAFAVRGLGGVLFGYLVGGGLVWAIRIGGTLGFGKEAMGLGDVHLMGAVGAAAGWSVAVLGFFIAPFFGLAYAIITAGLAKLYRRELRIIPYGPHLAAGSFLAIVGYRWFGPLAEQLGWLIAEAV